MKITAIRHTSVEVLPGICYGQSDVATKSSFNEESETVARNINGILFDVVYSSSLSRCRKLAERLFPGKPVFFDERLKELNFGDWELKSWNEIYATNEGQAWMDNYQALPTLNGESYPEMEGRVRDFVQTLKQGNSENIAIVTHAGVIRILKSIITGIPVSKLFESFKPGYGSITEFEL